MDIEKLGKELLNQVRILTSPPLKSKKGVIMELKQIFELHNDIVERLSALHDAIYDRVDQLFKEHDLCNVSYGKCLAGDFCCSNGTAAECEHLSPAGCTVKSLACKLSVCSTAKSVAKERNKEVLEEIFLLRDLAGVHYLTSFRTPKEKVFDRFVLKDKIARILTSHKSASEKK